MKQVKRDKRAMRIVAGAVALLSLGWSSLAAADSFPGRNDQNPNAPSATGVLMANGVYDPADASFVPPTADEFDTVIMGRSEAEKLARRQLAIDYFVERYGIDLSAGFADDGNIVLVDALIDPRNNYRAYQLPGKNGRQKSFAEGRIVYDRQYVMFMGALGRPVTLYGTWGGAEGTEVPPGSAAVDGDYLIQAGKKFRRGDPRNVYIRFQSVDPILGAATGNIKFNCVLLDENGEIIGAAIGRQEIYPIGDGLIQYAIQNVWQFPAPVWALP